MKTWILGVAALLVAGLAWADAIVTSASGTVTAQPGAAASRTVRQGDRLRAGETVSTARGSSAVLHFEDGQVVALGQNSRMEIERYDYNAQAKTGNIALRLFNGGMRAISGLIARTQPKNVAYRAGLYTIGIRGTNVTIAFDGGNAVVSVTEGAITFTYGNQTITVSAGEGVNARSDGSFQRGAIDTIIQQLQGMPGGQSLLDSLGGAQSISIAVGQAAAGQSGTAATPGPGTPGSSAGGGAASTK